jgi:hypothetical protein
LIVLYRLTDTNSYLKAYILMLSNEKNATSNSYIFLLHLLCITYGFDICTYHCSNIYKYVNKLFTKVDKYYTFMYTISNVYSYNLTVQYTLIVSHFLLP